MSDVENDPLNETKHNENEEPEYLHCPITQAMFNDPVMLVSSGHTYERRAILRHLTLFNSDPVTNRPVRIPSLVVNWIVRKSVERWLEQNPDRIPSGWKDRRVLPPADYSILHQYVRKGTVPRIKDIIKAGADVNAQEDAHDCTALHICLRYTPRNKQEEIFKILLANGSDVNSMCDHGYTALHYCASDEAIWDREYVVRALISNGANVNAKNTFGYSPLYYCASHGNVEVARLLVNAGADVNAEDEFGRTPLFPDLDVWKNEYIEIVRAMIDVGADINRTDNYGMTPLHACAKEGCCVYIAKGLIALGSSVKAKDNHGDTVLHTCLRWGIHSEWVGELSKIFLKEGADVNARNNDGLTPLDICAQNAYEFDVFDVLIKGGADVNCRDDNGGTALHKYSLFSNFIYDDSTGELGNGWGWGGCTKIIRSLVENGAHVNVKDNDGLTPLHTCRNLESMEYLIQKGANVNAITNKGETALHLCAGRGDLVLVKALIDAGTKLSLRDNQGRTFLKM